VLAAALAAGLALASPAQAAGVSVDFGQKLLGESETKTVTIPLSHTVGDIRGAFGDAVGDHSFGSLTLPTDPPTTLAADQVQALVKDAVENLDGASKFSLRVVDLHVTGDSDFTVGGECKNGDDQPTCDFDVTFAAAVEGPRQAKVNAEVAWSQGQGAMTDALAEALGGVTLPPNSDVDALAKTALGLLDEEIVEVLAAVINPVAQLTGAGAAPGSGGGTGQTPTPGTGGGTGGGSGNHLPQTGLKVAEIAGGGLLLVLLGVGTLLAVRRRETAA
jgi:LPXTG-motif cell wall-anchored protein